MRKYINYKGPDGVETFDEIRREDFKSLTAYRQELRNVLEGYRDAGMAVYLSNRSTKEWRK